MAEKNFLLRREPLKSPPMPTSMKRIHSPNPVGTSTLDTRGLRSHFLLENLFQPGKIETVYWDCDRTVVGGAMPLAEPLQLSASRQDLAAEFFLERREAGILNIGGPGRVTVDGVEFSVPPRAILYAGRGSRQVLLHSESTEHPAIFYILSYPAHQAYPAKVLLEHEATAVELGARETANERTILKFIHPDGIKSCQLVMGITKLKAGSVWNTMPPHTHLRRSEVYLYFDLAPDSRVLHLMGEPSGTRHLLIGEKQAVLSPPWSIHAGAGTAAYSFCWGMGGENQDFTDMDGLSLGDLL